ncbi:MAG: TetR family transcriptional regulator [Nitrososphaerales archaeon]
MFREKGFRQTTMDEIARKLGISKAAGPLQGGLRVVPEGAGAGHRMGRQARRYAEGLRGFLRPDDARFKAGRRPQLRGHLRGDKEP